MRNLHKTILRSNWGCALDHCKRYKMVRFCLMLQFVSLTFADWYFSIPDTSTQTLSVSIADQVIATVASIVCSMSWQSSVHFDYTMFKSRGQCWALDHCMNGMIIMSLILICIFDLQIQVGATPIHFPSRPHLRVLSPLSLYPGTQA